MVDALFIVFDLLNLGLVIFLWWFTIKNYKALPQRIPTHFDVEGKPDNFGNKKYAFFTPILSIIFYIGIFFLIRSPETANFPVEITDENRDVQFFIMNFFIRWLLLLICLIFLNNQDFTFRYTYDEDAKAKVPFSTMLLSIIGSLIVVFIITAQFK
ncbi:DUF1648 domain-containing protein [Chryseobacterium aahli]|uniref:DUF1648 domain-containing protein n=1 Tax=Chryseobacterium aahli TaxID=1278643 RepID=UPI001F60FD5B|nr:DUF1648 domain-containing protein [Chryseobacterium aahli]MCI3938186.1 DUF1648 domain-containing protein [Chryseobacterium aahli]